VEFVRNYYDLLNQRDFDSACARLSPELQARLSTRESWEQGYAFTEGTDAEQVSILA
jgi:hypothetical protein